MKFIKFFCLFSLTAIIAAVLAEDAIVQAPFFRSYLDENVQEISRQSINTSEIPSEVMKSFLQSPFKDLSIQEVYKIEDHAATEIPALVKKVMQQPKSGTLYVLALADNIHQSVKTVLSFNNQGKLLNIERN